jgi:hypothetical protein
MARETINCLFVCLFVWLNYIKNLSESPRVRQLVAKLGHTGIGWD